MGNTGHPDLLTFTFIGPVTYDVQRPLLIDAEDPSRSLNAIQVRSLVRTLIAGLRAHGVQNGDCVLVHLPNSIIYPPLFYAIIGAGGVYMGSNPRSQPHELDHIIGMTEPKMIITSNEALSTVLTTSANRGMSPGQICVVDEFSIDQVLQHLIDSWAYPVTLPPPGGSFSFAQLLVHGEDEWVTFDDEASARNTPAAMFSTSGTGGLPKAAILSHHAIACQHLSIHYDVPYSVSRLISLPMFHLFGSLFTHITPIRYGHPLFVLPRFDLAQYVSTISQYQVTETYMVPAMVHALNRCGLPLAQLCSSLRYIAIAGAPITADSLSQFQNLLSPHTLATQLWGMTETGIAFQHRYGYGNADPASVGPMMPGYEVRVIGPDGSPVAGDNSPGEIYVRGPGLLTGYKGRNDAFSGNGWFPTGDLAYTKWGLYYIVGRVKELIKVRGYVPSPFLKAKSKTNQNRWQVPPAELESILLKHPGIADAAVTGVSSADGTTEVPRAFVVPARSQPPSATKRLTAEEVYLFARGQLASYKALDGGVYFVEEIPRTPAGKIQRFKLSQMNSYREIVAGLLSRFQGEGGRVERVQSQSPIGVVTEGRVTV